MGLFTPKPYKLDRLSVAEKAAVATALEVGAQCGKGSNLAGELNKARRHANSGALTKNDLVVTIACLVATLDAVNKQDTDDLRSTLLKAHAAMQVAFASALEKLKNML